MKPVCLISDFLGSITFPHYTKFKENNGVLSASVVYSPNDPIENGYLVTHRDMQKNTRIFSVQKVEDNRKAKGDWSFADPQPMFCKITAKHVGFWNPIKDHPEGGTVEPEYITDKKTAA